MPFVAWLALAALLAAARASNWAQVSGTKLQNVATQSTPGWTNRWGHAMTSYHQGGSDILVVLGGDSYFADIGSGILMNDVWISLNLYWSVVVSTVQVTQYGAPLPKIVSQANWAQISTTVDAASNNGISYHQLLCCDHHSAADMWPCDLLSTGLPLACDPFAKSRVWSPRRSHVALTVEYVAPGTTQPVTQIVVLGGRARYPHEGVPDSFIIGHTNDTNLRDKSTLMNDAWTTDTSFSKWSLQNPGCWVHNAQFMYGPMQGATCTTTYDCYATLKLGTNGDQAGGTVSCVSGRCVCNIWTPRERFAAAVYGQSIFVSGGVTEVTRELCGIYACGTGNRLFLNDLWASPDLGRTWVELSHHDPTTRWQPRGDHGMVIVPSGMLFVLGGRGGSVIEAAYNPTFNDVWTVNVSANLATPISAWVLQKASAEWSPRAGLIAAYSPAQDELLVFGGEEYVSASPSPSPLVAADAVAAAAAVAPKYGAEAIAEAAAALANAVQPPAGNFYGEAFMGVGVHIMNEVWTVPVSTPNGNWTMDFSNSTYQSAYVDNDSPLSHPSFNFTDTLKSALSNMGITTLGAFAFLSTSDLLALKLIVPNLCRELFYAQTISYTCSNQHVMYDGEFMRTLRIIEGNTVLTASVTDPTGCIAENAKLKLPESLTDVTCRQRPYAKRHASAVTVGTTGSRYATVYVSGGYTNLTTYGDDVWYRNPTSPVTTITQFPSSGSSDTVFNYGDASCSGCMYEYQLFNGDRTILKRNWSLHSPPLDYKDWLSGGLYWIQFRAIDAAGNRDLSVEYGRNAYAWRYVPPLPWLLIILGILLFIAIVIAIVVWYRRRQRRIALERYALKRARRKLKAAKTGDWRTMYDESGNLKKGKKGKKAKKRKDKGSKTARSKSSGSKSGRSSSRKSARGSGKNTSRSKSSKKTKKSGKSTSRSKSKKS